MASCTVLQELAKDIASFCSTDRVLEGQGYRTHVLKDGTPDYSW